MLKISPISGTIWYYKKRNLEIVISFEQAGTGESYSIYILRHWTTEQGETSVPRFLLPYYEWTAYFNGTHGSPDALHYYIDIDDDKLVQGNYLEFKLQLWRINRHWDSKHLSGYDIYCINDVGHSEIVNITSIEEFESVPMKTEAKINVTTIGVEKANTIAIYETNGTVFNGHYQEQERMNIIQLYVNDSGAGTPFVEGPNVIVIPTSLFTETIFNAYVQNETLHETPIYSADDEIFKFISVGRDGSTEQACDEIDFVFIRFEISSQDAMEILNLLLECLVNETTNETAIVYSYASTKINGTLAVMMNLPISVLGFVPWFCDFENSPIGSKPETKSQAFWKGIKKLVSLAVGLIVAIGMAILELVELIAEFVMEILMEWLPILEYILWLIIRVLLLILIWIIFAITLIITISLFLTVLTAMFLFGTIIDLNIKSSINKLNVEGDIDFSFKYDVKLEFNEFIDFYIPTLDIFLNMSGFSVEISLNIFSINLEIIDFSVDLLENIDDNGLGQSAIHHLKSSSISSTIEGITDFIFGVGLTLSILGGFVGFYTATLAVVDEAKRDILYILGTIAYVLTIVILILTIICLPDTFSVPYIFGMATGCIISGLVFLFVSRYIKNPHKYMYQLKKFFGGEIKTTEILVLFKIIKLLISGKNIVDFLLKIFNIKGPIADNELRLLKKARSSFITGSFAMFLGSAGIILLGNRNRKGKSKLAILFCVTSLIGGSVLIGIGKWRLNN